MGEELPEAIATQEYLNILLKSMRSLESNEHHFPLMTDEVTFEEYKSIFTATRETTASSPSGIHIGHYQVGAYYPEIGKTLAIMMTLPFKYGFAPNRWRNSIHLMLEKCHGRPIINKLRIIQLFEADFNAYLKIKISRQLMRKAEKQGLFGSDMHGGLKGKSTHDALLTQQLTYNITQQQRSSCASLNLDATKCFDRIFPNLMVPALERIGTPHNTCVTIAKTLRHMKHRVRTAHGVSSRVIQAPLSELWSGVGQGGAASGPAWLAMELPILEAMKKYSPGIQLQGPANQPHFTATAIGYIDDNNIVNTYRHNIDYREIQSDLQTTLNGWSGLLSATGGALSQQKCTASSWTWEWKHGLPVICDLPTNVTYPQTQLNITHSWCD